MCATVGASASLVLRVLGAVVTVAVYDTIKVFEVRRLKWYDSVTKSKSTMNCGKREELRSASIYGGWK